MATDVSKGLPDEPEKGGNTVLDASLVDDAIADESEQDTGTVPDEDEPDADEGDDEGGPQKKKEKPKPCEWRNQAQAFREFAEFSGLTQSALHIKPLHWYIASRLVIEGGFLPDDVTPRPPLVVTGREGTKRGLLLSYDSSVASHKERTIIGGLKTKNVDVVAVKGAHGPALAVSCKGMTGALRNLTNRMEETIGEATNLHLTYKLLVFGYLFVIRANRRVIEDAASIEGTGRVSDRNNVAISDDGKPVETLFRFHEALCAMSGRQGVRDEDSRYEAVALSVVDRDGTLIPDYPPSNSRVRLDAFFSTLYQRYEDRFILGVGSKSLRKMTRRVFWSERSPVFDAKGGLAPAIDYSPRIRYASD